MEWNSPATTPTVSLRFTQAVPPRMRCVKLQRAGEERDAYSRHSPVRIVCHLPLTFLSTAYSFQPGCPKKNLDFAVFEQGDSVNWLTIKRFRLVVVDMVDNLPDVRSRKVSIDGDAIDHEVRKLSGRG